MVYRNPDILKYIEQAWTSLSVFKGPYPSSFCRELEAGGSFSLKVQWTDQDLMMHRKPIWLVDVSVVCGWRAAGR